MLRNGEHADFTIQCGEREWHVHKLILNRCPYYKALLGNTSQWRENAESKSTIVGFEPFEKNWLLQVIYHPVVNVHELKKDLPGQSYLEACVRLWILGDYFRYPLLTTRAMKRLHARCAFYGITAVHCLREPDENFFPELEPAFRAAWAPDSVDAPFRKPLATLFVVA
ncbi:unnamed protein product [Discula destructiva]